MAIKLMYIANEPRIAHIAETNGVDRIFVDLEVRNKAKRQKNIDSVKSHHCLNDINKIKDTLTTAELLVRSNAMYEGSQKEINEIVERGADIVMLPMWESVDDAKRFRDYIDGRAKVMLLLETIPAEKALDEVLELDGIDEILIGLNDLHLQYKLKFLFELLANGKVDELMNKMVADGKSVVMISSEMPELLGMCDRIYVMNEGRLLAELNARETTQEEIMGYILRDS